MVLNKITKFSDTLSIILAEVSVILVLLLMLNVVIEVASRYIFNNPTIWSIEVAQYLFGMTFLLSGAYTLQQKGHVRVDIVLMLLKKKTRRILGIICHFITIFYLLILLYISSIRAYESIYYLEVMDTVWAPYTWPVMICVPIGVAAMILQSITMTLQTWQKMK